jgi:hypothetical protein
MTQPGSFDMEALRKKAAESKDRPPLEGRRVKVIVDNGEQELVDHPDSLGKFLEVMKGEGRTFTETEPGVFTIDPK